MLESPCWVFWSWPWPCLRKVNCAVLCPEYIPTQQVHAAPCSSRWFDLCKPCRPAFSHGSKAVMRQRWCNKSLYNLWLPRRTFNPQNGCMKQKNRMCNRPNRSSCHHVHDKTHLGTAPFRIVGPSVASWSEAFFGLCQFQQAEGVTHVATEKSLKCRCPNHWAMWRIWFGRKFGLQRCLCDSRQRANTFPHTPTTSQHTAWLQRIAVDANEAFHSKTFRHVTKIHERGMWRARKQLFLASDHVMKRPFLVS